MTDGKLKEQLDYNKRINESKMYPVVSRMIDDYYVLSTGENPEVVKRNRVTKEVTLATAEQAKSFIERYMAENEAAMRDEAAKESLGKKEEEEDSTTL